MSDGSATVFTDTSLDGGDGKAAGVYTLRYRAAQDGKSW